MLQTIKLNDKLIVNVFVNFYTVFFWWRMPKTVSFFPQFFCLFEVYFYHYKVILNILIHKSLLILNKLNLFLEAKL